MVTFCLTEIKIEEDILKKDQGGTRKRERKNKGE
jgi:hypothetical protein